MISWHRFYDPEAGRYISADPIGLLGGMNLYEYGAGNPINWIDPLGLDVWRCSRPLNGLPGQPYPPIRHHDYPCATDSEGNIRCGSTTPTTDDYLFGTPARATTSKDGDYYSENACNIVDKGNEYRPNCVEECVIREIDSKWRPTFAVGPNGTDCQEWTDDTLNRCINICSKEFQDEIMDFISNNPKPSSRY